jgi:crotonobetainyl-CoA:carnitine CoA-transferase CaiB-like acyl-CoA transferase
VRALGLGPQATKEEAAAALRERGAQEVEDTVTRDAGVAVRVRELDEWMAGEQAAVVQRHDLLQMSRPGVADPVPTPRRPRVLDLTRVLAGPVATRTLAYLGCDVLRVDSPSLPELPALHVDTGAGKRSTLVNLHNEHARERLHGLLAEADVLVTGYRPGALAAYHLDGESLVERHPHLIVATLSAWTPSGPWGSRRGFDSIVQAATGIAMIESPDGHRPGVLPAQVLDHATGYLLAAGILTALRRRAEEGGTWRVGAHLARTAHWLLQTDAVDSAAEEIADPGPWMVESATSYGRVVQARPAFQIDDGPSEFAWVGRRWGADEAAWDASS